LRYETRTDPVRVTVCHCRFCQRATGSAYMVEPIFRREDVAVTRGEPSVFALRSEGSGRTVRIHFCPVCGTKLFLTFERFPDSCGVYAGTFDDPSWFPVGPENSRHIFVDMGRPDSVLPEGTPLFAEHAIDLDGQAREPARLDRPRPIADRRHR
jgi:hypothetical protein